MELHFLGTGSAYPSPNRSSSCLALRHNGDIWVFDCGEGSQIQFQKSKLRSSRISKIFITHLHGDHLFGLPGLLCTIGFNQNDTIDHVDIYGPIGLKNFVRASLLLSCSLLSFSYSVHEIMIPSFQGVSNNFDSKVLIPDISKVELPLHPNETKGKEIQFEYDGYFDVCQTTFLTVIAVPLKHSIPCIGYVLKEKDLPGKLNTLFLNSKGVPAGPLFGKLKMGEPVTLANGDIILPEQCLGPAKKGRKIVILGDTCNSDEIIPFAIDADILVHEATNENADEKKSVEHGHSTAGMAGRFAALVRARTLIITHFSQRYKTISDESENDSIQKLKKEAEENFNGQVIAADDLLFIPVLFCDS
ncbi:zinc phosphodiesterase ELAC protein 1 isoform X1 [Hydra vulgaris]|uniref:Zinc phosphodiesterase ELAC protein 1 n=1 Tax=Hydra vulgaris TaxID=6087 RepID=T2M5V8_HYDVU|nr:zinc phosphodiesterase ELAC protein 1 [Hydra vulgaris]